MEHEYERQSRAGPQSRATGSSYHPQAGRNCDAEAPSLYALTNGQRFNAAIAGRPPQRRCFGPKGCAAANEAFCAARAGWYEKLTGRRLARDELSLREQFRMCDAIARTFRVFTDGRRSLRESVWSGRLTAREARINNMGT